jgi:hypothetical protein
MRATSQFAFVALLCGIVSAVALGGAAALPGAPGCAALKSEALSSGLIEQVRTNRKRKVRRGYRRPYYAPYFCSQPYQYRYWMFYAPVCYPL